MALASFFITTHILLDMADGGVRLWFPVSMQMVPIDWSVSYNHMSSILPEGVALAIIAALVIALKKIKW